MSELQSKKAGTTWLFIEFRGWQDIVKGLLYLQQMEEGGHVNISSPFSYSVGDNT